MKRLRSLITVVVLLVSLGCSSVRVAYVPVREARFRSEVTQSERIKLPLDEQTRSRLIGFLSAGGDNDRIGVELVDPDAVSHYTPLLEMLSNANNLSLEDLTEKHTFMNWFSDVVVRQVIDAREESPPLIDPVAVTDGKYWWIFYHHHKKLAELLVIKAIPRHMDR